MNMKFSENSISVSFNEIISFVIGGDWGKDPSYIDSEYSLAYCIRGSEFKNWDRDKGKTASPRKIKNSKIENRILEEGDILVEISGGGPEQPVGRTVLIDKSVLSFEKEVPKVCTNFLRLVRTYPIINSKYLNFYLNLFYASGEVTKYQAGSNNLRNLKFDDFSQIRIPLIALPEQRAIVSKIEQLFSELDNGITNLKLAQEQLRVYRQAVLKKAFEGELTRKWREQQAELPSTKELLVEIRRKGQEVLMNAGKKGKVVKPLNKTELANLSDLPNGWSWIRLEEIGYWTGGGTPSKQNHSFWSNGDVLWVSPKDMKTKLIVDTEDKITTDSIENSSAKWITKDSIIFVVRSGIIRRILPIALAGKDLTTNQDLQSLTLLWGNKDYVYWYCQANEQIIRDKCAKDGTTVDSIEVPRLKSYPIAICSFSEQQTIVQQIETRLSVCDKLEQDIAENLEKAEALRLSILKRAFEGKLLNERELEEVRNASDWEPAEKLLERTKAQKASGK